MARRPAEPRKVEALARECRRLLDWLRGPGTTTEEGAYAEVMRGYRALRDAIAMLPRGTSVLRRERALLTRPKPKLAGTQRRAASFGIDEIVLLREPILTRQGWIVPAPLVPRVDEVAAALRSAGKDSTDKAALIAIIESAAESRGESKLQAVARDLRGLQVRLSRARKQAEAVSSAPAKVPPVGTGE